MANKQNYKRLGNYIREVNLRNRELKVRELKGININKLFMPSVANTIGVDLSKYKIVNAFQFACNLMHVGRDEKIPIAINKGEAIIVSPAYYTFEVNDTSELMPEYLMLWFSRLEFDRQAWFYTDSDVRGGMAKESFLDMPIKFPPIAQQHAIVEEYQVLSRRIKLNESICQKLEDTAQALYRKMFVDNIDPENLPEGWKWGTLGEVAEITMGQSPSGETYNENNVGSIFYQGRTDFGKRYPSVRVYTTSPKKMAKAGDVLLSVRAPVGDLNIATEDCCIGRGLASIRSVINCNSFMYYTLLNLKPVFNVSDGEGTIFGSISGEELKKIKTIISPISLMTQFDNLAKKIDHTYNTKDREIFVLIELQSLLLSKLTTN